MLSSRLVKITRNAVVWQCVGDQSKALERAKGLEQLSKHPSHRWYTLWYRFVETYTNKRLTFPSDKLLAFHGIAMDKSGTNYVAGLLRQDPWASLLWCRDENQVLHRPGQRYTEYVAPSWSWASLDVPVLFYEASGRQGRQPQLDDVFLNPELHAVEAAAASYFETGAVKSGHFELSAYCLTAYTGPTEPFLFNTRQGAHTHGRRNLRELTTGKPLGMIVFDVAAEAQDGTLVCCVLLHVVNIGLWLKNGTAGLGIALTCCLEATRRLSYKRVGYVQFTTAARERFRLRRIRVI